MKNFIKKITEIIKRYPIITSIVLANIIASFIFTIPTLILINLLMPLYAIVYTLVKMIMIPFVLSLEIPVKYLISLIRRKEFSIKEIKDNRVWKESIKDRFKMNYKSLYEMIGIFIILIWGFTYIETINPSTVEEYTIKNDSWKEIVFQQMIHIGSQSFYDTVKNNLESHQKDGYTVYYEAVKSVDDKEAAKVAQDKFDSLMGVKFDANVYPTMAWIYWLVPQRNKELISNLDEDKLVRADTTISKIVDFYESKYGTGWFSNKPISISWEDGIYASVKEAMDTKLTKFWKEYIQRASRSMLSFMIKHKINELVVNHSDAIPGSTSNLKQFMDSILNFRNDVIVNEFLENPEYSSDEKIYMIYGWLHFDWVLSRLKEKDSSWKIVNKKELNPFETDSSKVIMK